MKKTILLNASPHKDGFTQQLIDIFLSDYNGALHIYNMYEENIAPCIGCGRCETTKQCFMHDMDKLFSDIFSADYIILASPIYNYSFPSPMKAFLDRLQPCFADRKDAIDRKGFLLVSCGKSGKFSVDVVEKQSKMAFSELSAEFCGSFLFADTDKRTTLQQEEICKVKNLSQSFFS